MFVIWPYLMHAVASKLLVTSCSVVQIRLSRLCGSTSKWLCRFLNQFGIECVSHQGTVYNVAMKVVRSVCNATLFQNGLCLYEERLDTMCSA